LAPSCCLAGSLPRVAGSACDDGGIDILVKAA
jgi:hypothetical protein